MNFKVHKASECEIPVREMLHGVEEKIGFIPNVFGMVSESTPTLAALIELNNLFSHTSLNEEQREIIQMVTSVANNCGYCVAGHTAFYSVVHGDPELASAIRDDYIAGTESVCPDVALAVFTRQMFYEKGSISKQQLDAFYNAGFNARHVIEVILGIAIKTITNLSNNVSNIALDEQFQRFAWTQNSATQKI